jgi:DNA transformation protein
MAMQDSGLVDHCLELLAPLGRTRAARMFSGYGLYVDDLCIALILRDTLYLKVDDAHRADFEAAGCRPFTYETKKGERQSISYYSAPDEAMESAAEMRPWARRALEAAVAARAKAAPRRAKAAARPAAKKAPARAAAKKAAPAKAAARARASRA